MADLEPAGQTGDARSTYVHSYIGQTIESCLVQLGTQQFFRETRLAKQLKTRERISATAHPLDDESKEVPVITRTSKAMGSANTGT